MGNKDSDQARQWLRLSLFFVGRICHFFDLRKHSREICGLPPIIATTPSITFYSQFLCRVCNYIMIHSFTRCSEWQVTMNTFELTHYGQSLKK